MRIKPLLILLIFLISLSPAKGQEAGDVNRDMLFWGFYEFGFRMHRQWAVNFKHQFRLNENISRFDYSAIDAELEFRQSRFLRLYASYRLNTRNHWRDGWRWSQQIRATASLRFNAGDFRFYNRSRLQSGLEDVFDRELNDFNSIFYRNRTRVKYSIDERWDVYAFYEMYFRLGIKHPDESSINRHRYSVGCNFQYNPRENVRVFVMYQDQVRNDRPDQRYFIGVGYTRTIKLY